MSYGWVAVGAALLAGQSASAQEPRISMRVDTTVIHVGDPVTARLTVDHPEGWAVQWPDSFEVAPFEVLRLDRAAPVAAESGDGMRSDAALVVTSFELGELELPSITVPVTAPDGTTVTLLTDPFRIGVVSVGLDESGDLRDIRGPLSIPRSWWFVVPLLLIAAAMGAGAYYLRRRRRAPAAAAPPVPRAPPRPFHVIALEALRALEKSSLLEQGRVKEYHIRVSEIIREYVEGQMEVPALELTTREVVEGMRRAAIGATITEKFRAFLDRCDLVKFAKLRPGADESREVMGWARELVGVTSGGAVGGGVVGGGVASGGAAGEGAVGGGVEGAVANGAAAAGGAGAP